MTHDCIIIGGGPAGYEAAAIAANRGDKVLLVERDKLGGTCLNRGCIPTKSFCRSAEVAMDAAEASAFGIMLPEGGIKADMAAVVARKNAIVDQLREGVSMVVANAETLHGEASFVSSHEISVGGSVYSAPKIVIASGSEAARLPIPGAELAVTSTELLDATALPESLAIIGGGVIGMEFASVFSALGSEVTVIEYCKEILPPFDKDIAKRLRTTLQRRGVKFHLSAEVMSVEPTHGVLKQVNFSAKGKVQGVEAETVLMAVGRRAVIPHGAPEAGFDIGRRVTKAVDDVSFDIRKGEVFGLVGESGCGKTTTGRSIIKLYNITSGNIYFKGTRIAAGTQSYKDELQTAKDPARIAELKAQIKAARNDQKNCDKAYAAKRMEELKTNTNKK